MRSRSRRDLKTEQDDGKNVYYGYPNKSSRSKSKRGLIERKNSKKNVGLKNGLTIENKKVKTEAYINQ